MCDVRDSEAGVVMSVQVGAVREIKHESRVIRSGIVKEPVEGAIELTACGFVGDEQADLRHHGTLDKAVCAYPREHYAWWEAALERRLSPGAFDENLSLAGMTETTVCIGDTYALGEAVVQVSQPRQPCFKVAELHGVQDLALRMRQSGRTGYYFRVLRDGIAVAGSPLHLLHRPHPQLTVAEANRILHLSRHDVAAYALLLVPELSTSWRTRLLHRLSSGSTAQSEPHVAVRIYAPSPKNKENHD